MFLCKLLACSQIPSSYHYHVVQEATLLCIRVLFVFKNALDFVKCREVFIVLMLPDVFSGLILSYSIASSKVFSPTSGGISLRGLWLIILLFCPFFRSLRSSPWDGRLDVAHRPWRRVFGFELVSTSFFDAEYHVPIDLKIFLPAYRDFAEVLFVPLLRLVEFPSDATQVLIHPAKPVVSGASLATRRRCIVSHC